MNAENVFDTRRQILDAAEKLFEHYGYQKTSMTDIAGNCAMSAANIYRFFQGKDEIIDAIAARVFGGIEEKLRERLRVTGMPASEKLETFIVENLRHLDMICTCHGKIDEALEYIKMKKPKSFERHTETKRSMIAEILAEGNRSGEFQVDDIIGTAGLVLNATFLCKCQWVGDCPPIHQVEKVAKDIVRLLVNGLKKS